MENKLQNVLVCHKRSKLELVDHLVNMSKSDTVLQNCHQLSSVGGLTDVLYNDMHCTCCYLFDGFDIDFFYSSFKLQCTFSTVI